MMKHCTSRLMEVVVQIKLYQQLHQLRHSLHKVLDVRRAVRMIRARLGRPRQSLSVAYLTIWCVFCDNWGERKLGDLSINVAISGYNITIWLQILPSEHPCCHWGEKMAIRAWIWPSKHVVLFKSCTMDAYWAAENRTCRNSAMQACNNYALSRANCQIASHINSGNCGYHQICQMILGAPRRCKAYDTYEGRGYVDCMDLRQGGHAVQIV